MKLICFKSCRIRKLLYSFLSIFSIFIFASCSNDNSERERTLNSMQSALDLYFDESKSGKIDKERFFLDGAVLFGTKAGDYDFRILHYDFGDNSYFNLTYKEVFDYTDQKDIFRNKLSRSSPGYVGQVVKFPSETITLNCTVSFDYGGYTVANTLKVELYGGSESTAAKAGWTQIDKSHYKYSSSSTITDEIDRPKTKYNASGEIDLENLTLDYRTKCDQYVYGLFSHTSYSYSYHYNALTKTIEATDYTNSYKVQTQSISLDKLYDSSTYENAKNNGWDWKILDYGLGSVKLFDKLLVENGKSSYVSILYGGTYTTDYLFRKN